MDKLPIVEVNGVIYTIRSGLKPTAINTSGYPICTVPEGVKGDVSVIKYEIKDDTGMFIHNMQACLNGYDQMEVRPGHYTKLGIRGNLIMSDTDWELRDMSELAFVAAGGGHGLIHGLGLGCAVDLCFYKGMDYLTVIEIDKDVVDLVMPHMLKRHGNKLKILHDDALTWKGPKNQKYDLVWHDIWPEISLENLPEIKKLNRRYGRKTRWQGHWAKGELATMKRGYKHMLGEAYQLNPPGSELHESLKALDEKNKAEIGI